MIRTNLANHVCFAQWLSRRVLDLRLKGHLSEPYAVIVCVLEQDTLSLLLSTGQQPRKHFCLGRKVSTQTKHRSPDKSA